MVYSVILIIIIYLITFPDEIEKEVMEKATPFIIMVTVVIVVLCIIFTLLSGSHA